MLRGADMLIVLQRREDDIEVQLVGHGGNHDLPRRHAPDRLTIQLGLLLARFGKPAEALSGKGAEQRLGLSQRLHQGGPGGEREDTRMGDFPQHEDPAAGGLGEADCASHDVENIFVEDVRIVAQLRQGNAGH